MSSMVPKQNGTGQWTVRSMNISPSCNSETWKQLYTFPILYNILRLKPTSTSTILTAGCIPCVSVSMIATPQFEKHEPKLTQWNGLRYGFDPIWCFHHKFLFYQSIDRSMCMYYADHNWSIVYFFICSRCLVVWPKDQTQQGALCRFLVWHDRIVHRSPWRYRFLMALGCRSQGFWNHAGWPG